jgi:hypothetical protein
MILQEKLGMIISPTINGNKKIWSSSLALCVLLQKVTYIIYIFRPRIWVLKASRSQFPRHHPYSFCRTRIHSDCFATKSSIILISPTLCSFVFWSHPQCWLPKIHSKPNPIATQFSTILTIFSQQFSQWKLL